METNHTPGPWIAEEQFNPKESGYRTTGRIFAHTRHVASVHTADSVREADANARLIAAAPALAEALRRLAAAVAEAIECDDPSALGSIVSGPMDGARAALADAGL